MAAVRRHHANPVKLDGTDGVVQFVSWSHVTLIAPAVDPPTPVRARAAATTLKTPTFGPAAVSTPVI